MGVVARRVGCAQSAIRYQGVSKCSRPTRAACSTAGLWWAQLWRIAGSTPGAALAAWLGGVARDLTGDYGIAFILAGVLAIAATGLSLGIRRAPVAAAPVAGD